MTIDFHPTFDVPEDNECQNVPMFWARCKYDFAVDGGAQGAINLFPSVKIPSGSLVIGAYYNVLTPPASGGAATLALSTEGADDIEAATVISGAPWSTTGRKVASDLPLGAAPIELTADRNVVATIGAADLTDGVFEVLVAYLPPGL